jgi:photosystem II stability/assembly factor-like uncharacterized protein
MSGLRRFWWVIAGIGSIALLSACSANLTVGTSASGQGNSAMQAVKADQSMEHIHNLLLTDKGLLIGTHEGLWWQQGTSSPARIGKSHFDVMGLAPMSDGIVASGHPGAGEEQVNDLGLRQSGDQGKTWKNTSLFGEVDFHRLVASGATVMGVSAHDGALLRSIDSGKTWKTMPNPNLYDLAMDPTDPSIIVGTTQAGPIRSNDGGKTFVTIPNAPLIAFTSWDKARLVGVAPNGVVYESIDLGLTWRNIGKVPGEPSALSARGNEIALLAGSTVYYSSDSGATFKARIVGVMGH